MSAVVIKAAIKPQTVSAVVKSQEIKAKVLGGFVGSSTMGGFYLQTASRLAEFDTAQAKIDARQNLELQNIDGGTFN